MPLTIRGFKVYMPAKNFELSKRFYAALGFAMTEGWGGTADFELNGYRFRLQDYYVKDWAENWMVVIDVDDVKMWHERVQLMARSGEFGSMSVREPHDVDGSMVLEVPDPSGVLLVFVQ
jgi:predicted enzyme related to lactoylglutathione lyase